VSLLVPKYLQEREDWVMYSTEKLTKELESFVNENQDIREPYFVLFKSSFDSFDKSKERQAMSLYMKRPPLMKGSLVWWIDNTRGICIRLWMINHQGECKFNHEAGYQLQGILRAANG
jgi:hypothetical protein